MEPSLGDLVEDVVTGLLGIAMYKLESITGEIELGIQTANKQTDEYPTSIYYVNIKRIKVIEHSWFRKKTVNLRIT